MGSVIINSDTVTAFTSLSPSCQPSSSSATSVSETTSTAHSSNEEQNSFLSSFTTLNDNDDDDDNGKDISSKCNIKVNKGGVPQQTMLTPPMSEKEQVATPVTNSPSSTSTRVISRNEFVDSLISAASILLDLVWPHSVNQDGIKWFLKETLRRSRSSYCTLQVALYYIHKLKPTIQSVSSSSSPTKKSSCVFGCPKRCFLVCLIVASKFLQDRNFSMKTWSHISGLPLKELVSMEFEIIQAMKYDFNMKASLYAEWSKLLLICTYVNSDDHSSSSSPTSPTSSCCADSIFDKKISATACYPNRKQQAAQIFTNFDERSTVALGINRGTIATSSPCIESRECMSIATAASMTTGTTTRKRRNSSDNDDDFNDNDNNDHRIKMIKV